MESEYPRQTLTASVEIAGPGLHSGAACQVTLHPGESGIRFRRETGSWIEAHPSQVTETRRCTRLGDISTVEHLMSAFAGLNVTDCDVEVQGGELPAAGGCSAPYVEAIRAVGVQPCGKLTVTGPFARIFMQDLPSKFAIGLGEGWWRAVYIRENEFPGHQEFEIALTPEKYAAEVAPARTFVLEHEIEAARAAGLGRGLTEAEVLGIAPTGYLNEARFADEPARHKLLDVMGDLYLSGVPVAHLDVVAEFTGHTLNVSVAHKLVEATEIIRS